MKTWLIAAVLVAVLPACLRTESPSRLDPNNLPPVSECQKYPRVYVGPRAPESLLDELERRGVPSIYSVVLVRVDFNGRVADAQLVRSSGYDKADESAVEAAGRCVFHRVVKDGKPVSCEAELTFTFSRRL